MASVALPTRPRSRSRSPPELHANPAPAGSPTAQPSTPPPRPPRSLSRPPSLNVNIQAVLQSTPRRRVSGGLALQARDSLSIAVRKRTMSTGSVSARVARHNARRANPGLLQPNSKRPGRSTSHSSGHRHRSHSPAGEQPERVSRSPSLSSSSPSQSPTPLTPGQPSLSQGPSSYQVRGRNHTAHDSQGTTSTYPASTSITSRASSPSPDRSRTPSPIHLPKKPSFDQTPIISSLDLDPDDVNARLRLLVNNSYFLPPAHTKPELSPIRPSTTDFRPATSPNAFREFFRVGKKKERKASDSSGYTSEGGRYAPRGRLLRVQSNDPPQPLSNAPDGRFGGPRHGDGYFDNSSPDERTRNRVVVVRETLDGLPPSLPRAPFSTQVYNVSNTAYNDPTTHYDVPPPTHFPSFAELRLDAAGITGNVELDQFAPPGEPWSPAPSSPNGSSMDPQERVWRRAILEQAVDLSLSSTGSELGVPDNGSFARCRRAGSDEGTVLGSNGLGIVVPVSPRSPKNKKSWWGRRDKEPEDAQQRPSTSLSLRANDVPRHTGTQRSTHSLDVDVQSQTSLHRVKRDLGQRIIPNMQADLEAFEREWALRETEQRASASQPLRLQPLWAPGVMSVSAPVTPVYKHGHDQSDTSSLIALRPPPTRKIEKRREVPRDDVAREFMPGHSTIRKSLSSPLLSDLHEMGVDVEQHVPFPSQSIESLRGGAAPSFVLQDPSGVTSLVNSNTMDSFTTGSHYSDDEPEFDQYMSPEHMHEDDASLDQWNARHSSPVNGSGRPSLDSFGMERVLSPEYHPRVSSTFGFRRSNISVTTPSPLRGTDHSIEVDITGDPMDHLSMMESQRSPSPSGESRMSSALEYVSALDYTVARSSMGSPPSIGKAASLSMSRPTSPPITPFPSATLMAVPEHGASEIATEQAAPIGFFDSIQNKSFLEGDDESSESDEGAAPEPEQDSPFAAYSARPQETQTLGRKSLSSARPAPAFATQFRNASQPHLPVSRTEVPTAIDTNLRRALPYEHLDRKKPLTNMPYSIPAASSSGILSQLKGKRSKSPVKAAGSFLGIGKKRSGISPVVLPETTFELLRYPTGIAFSLGSGAGTTTTGSEPDSFESASRAFDATRSQQSLLSMQLSDSASFQQVGSWRQEQSIQDESLRKLDGMMTQHLEAERDRLRKIADAARQRGEGARVTASALR